MVQTREIDQNTMDEIYSKFRPIQPKIDITDEYLISRE